MPPTNTTRDHIAGGLRCGLHPHAAVRHFRAQGPEGLGVYAYCLVEGGMHRIDGVSPVPDEPVPTVPLDELSPVEREVLDAAARGLTVPETAVALGKGAETIKSQRNRVILKLGARNMTHAVCMAAAAGAVGWR